MGVGDTLTARGRLSAGTIAAGFAGLSGLLSLVAPAFASATVLLSALALLSWLVGFGRQRKSGGMWWDARSPPRWWIPLAVASTWAAYLFALPVPIGERTGMLGGATFLLWVLASRPEPLEGRVGV